MIAYQGSPITTITSVAKIVRDEKEVYWVLVAYWKTELARAPDRPAKKAEMQKTMTRVMLIDVPWVCRALGESDNAFRRRPRRPWWSKARKRTVSTVKTR